MKVEMKDLAINIVDFVELVQKGTNLFDWQA